MRREHVLAGSALAMALGVRAASAVAAPAVSLRVECPSLGDEAGAQLEARARAQMAAEATVAAGDLSIVCDESVARVVWHAAGAAPRERAIRLDGADRVDAVLDAIHDLRDGAVARGTPSAPAPTAESAEPVAPDADDWEAPRGEVNRASRAPARWSAVASVDAERWEGGIGFAWGASGGARLRLGDVWSARLTLGAQQGIGHAQDVSAWALRGIAEVDLSVAERLSLGLGLSGRALSAHDATGSPSSQQATTAGVLASIRYAARVGPLELAAGPRAEALLVPLVIRVDTVDVFRLPTLLVGVSLEAAFPALSTGQ